MHCLSILLDELIEPMLILQQLGLVYESLLILSNTRLEFNNFPHVFH